jgi:2-polyprenyl-3-methyl-5-hydroxy-6-metoxy-1,4-benzoquinol methylase
LCQHGNSLISFNFLVRYRGETVAKSRLHKFEISAGAKENDIVIGNVYDKYNSNNPIVRLLMKGFEVSLSNLVVMASPSSIHEIGCGEGYWVLRWNDKGISARGSDFSAQVIDLARTNAIRSEMDPSIFQQLSIYDLEADRDSADLVVCCEVLEHLAYPRIALQALQRIVRRHLIVSVPNEPLWSVLNLIRGKYISSLGNTPGHLQQWSRSGFLNLLSTYFRVVALKSPLPWTMILCEPISSVTGVIR